MDAKSYDPNDPERNRKRIETVGAVLNRIQKNLMTKTVQRSENTIKEETKEEKIEKILKAAKEERGGRNLQIGFTERYVIELIAFAFGLDENIILDCVVDSAENIKVLRSIFEREGALMILVQYQKHDAPSLTSGRYNPNLKLKKVDTALFCDGRGEKIVGNSVFFYRLDNKKQIESTNVSEEIFFSVLPEGDTVISSIRQVLAKVVRPALGASSDYGKCSLSRKNDFLYSVDNFVQFLESTTNDIVTSSVHFEVDHSLFKGFLLASHQIEATSKRRDKVAEVEHAFNQWLHQIKVVVSQGQQLVHNPTDAGPLTELEHWLKMLSKFYNVVEFTDSRPFQSYLKCLKLSRSKMIKDWSSTEDELIILLNEARDNVRYMSSVEKHWDPLYRCEPLEIADNLSNLLQAIRSVFNKSRYYNSGLRISGFLSKVVNQIIVACRNHLTNHGQIHIWNENMKNLVRKIRDCKTLKESFRFNYEKVLHEMKESGEKPFDCSENYFFGSLDLFETRLHKISEVMEVCLRYQVLDRIPILGMEVFSERIKLAFKDITENSYDPLAHRIEEFDKDYLKYMKAVTSVETEIGGFVKEYVEKIENVDMRLLTLKRFTKLNLDCLHLDRRYLDVAVMLEKEISDLKDKYNEERASPLLERNIPPVIARIKWSRSLMKKMEMPLNFLKENQCVIENPKAQIGVQCFNSLAPILIHYEAMHHKAWFTFASQVRSKLEAPLARKDPQTNHLVINLDRYVLQIVKESEAMQKLGLEVPEAVQVLTHCQDRVIGAYNRMTKLIERNNSLRRSIYPMFIPMMRIQLVKLERIFSPALSTYTWLTLCLDGYFEHIADILLTAENFVKDVSDMNDAQIEVSLKSIEEMILIKLPDDPVSPKELLDINVSHRRKVEKMIEMKSQAAESVAVDLINKFVLNSGVPYRDESGKFQLPQDKITEENRRIEEWKPINKYDWVSFGKLYKAVGYAAPEEKDTLCFKEYDGIKYDVNLLHIDCVELFAYYNHKAIAALAKCTKKSMEMLKKRSNISGQSLYLSCGSYDEKSLISVSIELRIPNFVLIPSMKTIQEFYDATLLNIIETHYAVSTWGKQAKIKERADVKPLIDEIRHEKSWFKTISEHKEVFRYKLSFENGVMQLDARIRSILDELYDDYSYLWSENRENEIEDFVSKEVFRFKIKLDNDLLQFDERFKNILDKFRVCNNTEDLVNSFPLLSDIHDKFLLYDKITDNIMNLSKFICIRTISINCEQMIQALVDESKIWKLMLGTKIRSFYRESLNEMIKFIKLNQRILSREILIIEDCGKALDCLEVIRKNFTRLDQTLNKLEKIYALLAEFQINIPSEETEKVDGLRYIFNSLCENVEIVTKKVLSLQKPLQDELEAEVTKFKEDLIQYDKDFDERGPMTAGISAKEAHHQIILFEAKLHEFVRLNEIYAASEKLYRLPVNEYPVLAKRMNDIELLNSLYNLYLEFMQTLAQYSETLFRDIDVEMVKLKNEEFIERFNSLPSGMEDWPRLIELQKKMEDFNNVFPVIALMFSPAIEDQQWRLLEGLMNEKFETQLPNFTLGLLLQAPLIKFRQGIEEICITAIKEQKTDHST